MNGLFVGCERLFVTIETLEGMALVEVGVGVVGAQLNGPLVGYQGIIVAAKGMQSITSAAPGIGMVGN